MKTMHPKTTNVSTLHVTDLAPAYAERAKCRKIEVAKGACHAVFASRSKQVAALIDAAATSMK